MQRPTAVLLVAATCATIAAPVLAQLATGPAIPAVPSIAWESADISAGEAASKKCQACHDFSPDRVMKIGPPMAGIMGQPAASFPNYSYSQVLMEMRDAGLAWHPGELAAFLANPREFSPGTKMAFAGIRNGEELANITAYLISLSPGYEPPAVEPVPPATTAPTDRRR